MDTYLQRSTIGVWWGKREAQLTIEVQWLVYVWRRREAYLMYYGRSIGIHAYVQERNKVGRETELECWRGW